MIANAAALLLTLIISFQNTFISIQRFINDMNMRWAMSGEPHRDIVVVGIDDYSLAEIGKFPWEREVYVPLIHHLIQDGAKVVAFDIMFNERGDETGDAVLSEELSKYPEVILPSHGRLSNYEKTSRKEMVTALELITPLPEFNPHGNYAHINAYYDKDGVIRKTWLQIESPEGTIPSLAAKSVELYGKNIDEFYKKDPQKQLLIKYSGAPSDFVVVPAASVIEGGFPEGTFKNKIVLIGFTAVGFEYDGGATPIDRNLKLVFAHANIVSQLLNDEYLAPENPYVTLLMIAIILILMPFIVWRIRPTYSVSILFAVTLCMFLIQYILFSKFYLVTSVVDPLAALYLSYLLNIAVKTYFETKQKNYITKQFGRYISPELVKQIASSGQEIQLGGINKELSILFLDVRGFTTLSEKLKPEEVVGFLNMMFNLITEKALDNHGTIDKFIGDAAMILFNAPLDVENHEYYAVKTAYDIQQGMESVRQEIYDTYGVTISVGIGVHTGEVVIGNIGSYLRVDYTAIGDNVNTAARIESQTTANQSLVSEVTYERTKHLFEFNFIGERLMKGKTVPVKLYEVVGPIQEGPDIH